MALSDVMKKKQDSSKKEKKDKINFLEDVRVFIALMIVACICIICAIFFSVKADNQKLENIKTVMTKYSDNQASIANLHALQSRSAEYKEQRDMYDAMITREALDQQEIMIYMDETIMQYDCILKDIEFSEITTVNGVNQISVTLKINGTYDNIMKFAYDTVNGEQIKRIDSVKLSALNDKEKTKSAEIVVVLFSK